MRCDTSYSWQLLAAAFVMALPAAQAMAADRPVSFVNDVMPVLTKSGCNMGICHAKAGGGQTVFNCRCWALSLRKTLSTLCWKPEADVYRSPTPIKVFCC